MQYVLPLIIISIVYSKIYNFLQVRIMILTPDLVIGVFLRERERGERERERGESSALFQISYLIDVHFCILFARSGAFSTELRNRNRREPLGSCCCFLFFSALGNFLVSRKE